MDVGSGHDLISKLPQDLIEVILSKLPIKYAVRTCILSRSWRYKWTSMTHISFDDKIAEDDPFDIIIDDETIRFIDDEMIRFINGFWSMHNGPIHKFTFSSVYSLGCLEVGRWLPFVCQKDVKELSIEFQDSFGASPCIFWCKNLTSLELDYCVLTPPPSFGGFPCIKHLVLRDVSIHSKDMERLISSCPLLECLKWLYHKRTKLTIRAPNLKHLDFQGELIDICLENTPLLADMRVEERFVKFVESDFDNDNLSSYSLEKSLGSVPRLERLCGRGGFTRVLSAGSGRRKFITYDLLKHIEFSFVNFANPKEVLVALHLIFSSPNLQELYIEGSFNPYRCHWLPEMKGPTFDYFKDPFLAECMLNRLKLVKITGEVTNPLCMNLIEVLLDRSPSLATMSIAPSRVKHLNGQELRKTSVKLFSFRRASPKVLIAFPHLQM